MDADITRVSPALSAALGRSVEDLLGEHLFHHVHPDDLFGLIRVVVDLFFMEITETHVRFQLLDNGWRWRAFSAELRSLVEPETRQVKEITMDLYEVEEAGSTPAMKAA